MTEVQEAMKAVLQATTAARVNVAVLGNREAHLHAHLTPRYPDNEQFPDCSPWNDPRENMKLPSHQLEKLKNDIRSYFFAQK